MSIDDIEDINLSENENEAIRKNKESENKVQRTVRIKVKSTSNSGKKENTKTLNNSQQKTKNTDLDKLEISTTLPHGIPGTQKIFLKTWGCSHNNSDSEYMAGQLAAQGYRITQDRFEADLWVLNSCTVKGPSQQNFLNFIKTASSIGKHIVLAGCVPQAQKNMPELSRYSVIGVTQIDRIVQVVEETLQGRTVRFLARAKKQVLDKKTQRIKNRNAGGARLSLPKIRKNPLVEIISINTGCLNACTYCKTKHARGDLASYDPEEIVERIIDVTKNEGIKEIWLTSEDLGAYGLDIGTNIAKLLLEIVKHLPSDVMLRLGMTNPPYILDHLEAIATILNHKNVYSFLHIPVQSGSDKVLDDMKRTYTCEEFCHVIDFMLSRVPNILLATDIICGFPTENDGDFDETIRLCEKYKFPKLHISQFYPRPGTPAMRMNKLPTHIVKSRSRKLTSLFESYETFTSRKGCQATVLVTETTEGDGRDVQWVGRNKSYEKILLPMTQGQTSLMGRYVRVRIVKTAKYHQEGEFLNFENNMGLIENKSNLDEKNEKLINSKIEKADGNFKMENGKTSKTSLDKDDRKTIRLIIRTFWTILLALYLYYALINK